MKALVSKWYISLIQLYYFLGYFSITFAAVSASSEYFFVIIAVLVLLSKFKMIKIYARESRVHTGECNPFPQMLAGLVSAVPFQAKEEERC